MTGSKKARSKSPQKSPDERPREETMGQSTRGLKGRATRIWQSLEARGLEVEGSSRKNDQTMFIWLHSEEGSIRLAAAMDWGGE